MNEKLSNCEPTNNSCSKISLNFLMQKKKWLALPDDPKNELKGLAYSKVRVIAIFRSRLEVRPRNPASTAHLLTPLQSV